MRRFVVNAVLAGLLGLVAFAVQSGYMAELAGVALADASQSGPNANCFTVRSSSGAGSVMTVCGTYTGPANSTFTITVAAVNNQGQITAINWSGGGQSGTNVPVVNGRATLGSTGLTVSFNRDDGNKKGNKYTFTERRHCGEESEC